MSMTEDQIQLAIDRARLEGRRMAHLADKVGQDTENFRRIAAKLSGAERDYLNGLAEKLEALNAGASES